MYQYLAYGMAEMFKLEAAIEKREEQLLDNWRQSMDLPRKQKKSRRKLLRLDWSINEYAKTLIL